VPCWLIGSLFQDNATSAIASGLNFTSTAATLMPVLINVMLLANTVTSTTFKVRGGGNNAGTYSVNGVSPTGRYLGGTLTSHLVVTEVQG
jgi:hypothetical protein